MNNEARDKLLMEMHSDIREIKTKQANDHAALHGENGMIEKHDKLDSRVQKLENHRNIAAWFVGVVLSIGGLIAAYLKK